MRRALIIAAIVVTGLGALAIRVVFEGRSALADGEAALARKDPQAAIRSFEASARWYLPFAPHVDDAYDQLRALTKSQQSGVALSAWRSIRSASLATRSLWTPHADDLAAANRAIAELSARVPDAGPAGDTTGAREEWYRGRLARDSRPSQTAIALAALGLIVWLAGVLALARWGITSGGALARRPALVAGSMIVVGLVCWTVGLYNA